METTTITPTTTPNALVKIIEQSGLDKQKSDQLMEKFSDLVGIAAEWEKRAKEIIVTDELQTDLMKQAREGRLLLKEKRVEVEKTRKQLKDASLKEGRAIDNIAGFITGLIEPTEKYLDDQEKFAERKAAERIIVLDIDRRIIIAPYVDDMAVFQVGSLGAMPESQFDAMFEGYKGRFEALEQVKKTAEEERIAKEKADAEAREAQRIENERLKKEAEERDKAFAAERAKVEQERKAAEDAARKEREAIEAKLEQQRKTAEAERKKIQAQLDAERKAAAEKEANEKRDRERLEEEQRQSELAPDREKLIQFADMLQSIELPQLKSKKAKQLAEDTKVMIATAGNHIRTNIKKI